MKSILIILAAFVVISLNAKVLWQADFDKDMGGFTVKKDKPEDSLEVENGELVMQFTHGIHKGIEIARKIPYPERGELVFDAVLNDGKKKGYRSWSLKLTLFGKLLAWNGYPSLGFAYYDSQGKWNTIAAPPENRKVNYRLRFDRVKKTLDVFLYDSLLPVKSFTEVDFSDPVEGKGEIYFGNYGYAPGELTHKIFGLKLETVSDDSAVMEPRGVWSEKFERNGTLADNGFKLILDSKKDQFTVEDGVLTMVCQNAPHKGMRYEKEIPGLLCGELTFEASTGQGTGYNNYSLSMGIGGMTFSWRGTSAWHLYHPSRKKWHILTNQVENGVWHKYKIRFDAVSRTAEFYVDDMESPVFIDTESEYIAKRKLVFRINNYGLCSGTIVNRLRNIELKAVPPWKKSGEKVLKGTMIFRGISDTYWPLKELSASLGEKEVSEFTLQIPAHHTNNDNIRFDLQPKPNPSGTLAKYIILADMPVTPIPQYALDMIRKSIENGGKLIILDGMFTLQKGEYAGTILEDILPVSVKDKWGAAAPLPDAKIHKHNGRISVIYRQAERGMVYVVPGNIIKEPVAADVLKEFKF